MATKYYIAILVIPAYIGTNNVLFFIAKLRFDKCFRYTLLGRSNLIGYR